MGENKYKTTRLLREHNAYLKFNVFCTSVTQPVLSMVDSGQPLENNSSGRSAISKFRDTMQEKRFYSTIYI